jgi:hypothetical protein
MSKVVGQAVNPVVRASPAASGETYEAQRNLAWDRLLEVRKPERKVR